MNNIIEMVIEEAERLGIKATPVDGSSTRFELCSDWCEYRLRGTFGGGLFCIAGDELPLTSNFETLSEALAFSAGFIRGRSYLPLVNEPRRGQA